MKIKRIFAFLLSLLMLLALCACGAAQKSDAEVNAKTAARGSYRAADEAYIETPMEAEMAYDADYGGFAAAEEAAMPMPAPAEAGGADTAAEAPAIDPEKIIYSGNATVETTEFDQTLEKLQTLVQQAGGFIESASISGSNYDSQARGYASNRNAYYSIRIPSARFQELMGGLSALGNVPYSNTYSENITSRYYDVQARLTAYETQEQRLLEMMEMAETVSDIIVIEDRLTELRWQIEDLQSTLNNWDRQVSYSSIGLSIQEVTVYTPEAKMSYGERLGLAVRSGLQNTADFFRGFLLWFLEALPALIILAVIAVVVIVIVRRKLKKRRARKAAEAEEK